GGFKLRKFIHFFICISVAALIVLISDNVAAAESPVNIKSSNKSVMLDIQEDGDYYKVFKDDQLLYGRENIGCWIYGGTCSSKVVF
ncbi:hypothetical protein, partial [Bacillus sonorensis]|uniref:hypothetical protein n=1 Tax=Bacillus sonorensis TaxID=119858 RepID=UPI00227F3018